MSDNDEDTRVPFTRDEVDRLSAAMLVGEPDGVTEFQVRKFFDWASKTRKANDILEMILDGVLAVRDVKHSIEETCDFEVVATS